MNSLEFEMYNLLLEYGPMVLSGLGLTISLSVLSLMLATVMGIAGAIMKLSDNPILNMIGKSYTALIRGVPDLVLMLLVYFGGQKLLNDFGTWTGWWDYLPISPFIAGVLTIGLIFGAYMTETFRGAFIAIPRGEIEAAKAIGMRRVKLMLRIVWPLIVPLVLPSYTNNWLVLLKTTALVSIIGLQDIMYNAYQAGRTSLEPFLFLFMAFFLYLALTLISDLGFGWLRRRYAWK